MKNLMEIILKEIFKDVMPANISQIQHSNGMGSLI